MRFLITYRLDMIGLPAMTFRPLPARAPAVLLREAAPLKRLFGQAQYLAHLQQRLESQLQPAARRFCRVASWRDGCLLLIVTDGHWATRLRYQQRRLQRQLQALEEFTNLTKIQIKVQPVVDPKRATGRTTSLSRAAGRSLQSAAESISDPKLRAALERLARHATTE